MWDAIAEYHASTITICKNISLGQIYLISIKYCSKEKVLLNSHPTVHSGGRGEEGGTLQEFGIKGKMSHTFWPGL